MLQIIPFLWQTKRAVSESDRLVMTILCRDEVDIIEENIRVHAALGVDAFAVMDNGSTDGTREKLAELAKEFEVHVIDQPSQTYQQAKWMTQLAQYARKTLNARWVISNDADEFWLPEQGSLKDYLKASDSVVTVPRSNMVLTEAALEKGYHFSQATHRVLYPICYDREVQKTDDQISMLLVPISPKVIVNPTGLIKLSGGNHRAKHWCKWLSARNEPGIRVYHYPIRSWEQFEANIQHRQQLLKLPNARMGDHYRRWVRLYEGGKLYEEFKRLVANQEQLSALEHFRVAIKDSRPSSIMQQTLELSERNKPIQD
ncbi:glycosyltransferase family 2 protein [Thiomicrorhabdus sp. zzn3]|uniref:glycosyltransferase family 2 protein n=1 Tax=Thiomicrorhabdus sp. zzn3 TaxID=3039775 RepID=UPI002436B270|nr:glycosyltransferase family 2 protein [Thiomicrorhabdus sp. zzn3]MDG6779022.1 glycosyltransferase family 2 protein [Thiomicrorhabdus sp. zzn3]